METPSLEQLRIAYGKITDKRLKSLLTEKDTLSPEAQQVLDEEIKKRKIDISEHLETQKQIALKAMESLTEEDNGLKNQNVQDIYEYTTNGLIKEFRPLDEIKEGLVEKGLTHENASNIVENLNKQILEKNEQKQIQAEKDIRQGAIWCIGGIIVTGITYSFASSMGGSYIITWGAIVFGAIQFFRGVSNSNKPFNIFE